MNLDLYLSNELFWLGIIFSFLFGITVGSFLNVVVYRVPNGININFPPSHCPKCKHRLCAADLVPLFSYLFLGRKCRYCSDPISPRYFTVELITGLLYTALFYVYGYSWTCLFYFLFVSCLICIFLIDFDTYTIPVSLIVFGLCVGIIKDIFNIIIAGQFAVGGFDPYIHIKIPWTEFSFPMLPSVWGIFVCFVFFVCITLFGTLLFRKEAMGGGDTLLACVIGANLTNTANGVWQPVVSFIVAIFLGAIIGILDNFIRKNHNDENAKEGQIPFGPYMVLGAFSVMFFYGLILKGWMLYCTAFLAPGP